VSLDSEAAHRKFRDREKIPFDLLADPAGILCRLFRVPVWNLLLARFAGRVTYVIGQDGRIREVISRLRPAGHAAETLRRL
jgi:peroxiredoxin Q/BCP